MLHHSSGNFSQLLLFLHSAEQQFHPLPSPVINSLIKLSLFLWKSFNHEIISTQLSPGGWSVWETTGALRLFVKLCLIWYSVMFNTKRRANLCSSADMLEWWRSCEPWLWGILCDNPAALLSPWEGHTRLRGLHIIHYLQMSQNSRQSLESIFFIL